MQPRSLISRETETPRPPRGLPSSSPGSFPGRAHAAPGQIKADGGDQGKFGNGMRAIRKKGIQVLLRGQVCKVKVEGSALNNRLRGFC